LRAYASRCDLALGDSEFNRQDLEMLGFPRTAVLPVVPDFHNLDSVPDYTLAGTYDDTWTNVLFVGRMVPNKKIEDVIRFFHAYHTFFNPRSRLLLVGAQGGFERYVTALHHFVASVGNAHVHFIDHVSDEELTALYEIADLFLCASEHEGFCVPIVEAFYKQIPVLAYAAAAVPTTMDGAGLLYEDKDPSHVAALMDVVVSNVDLQERLIRGQLAAVGRLRARDFTGTLLGLVGQILSARRAPAPRVTFDFWHQFDAAEEIEEIRLERPSVFKALPSR
jgi:glycosyltransferase involved in cell wall biosynthesis